MNYRHAFHAGNIGDCLKHALLIPLLRGLQRKPSAVAVLDTHAGRGVYDLQGEEAARTGEWHHGIGRLLKDPPAVLQPYVEAVLRLGLYPGSPALIRAMLRPNDRLICCELHPDDYAALRRHFAGDRQSAVHRRDAWEAMGAMLPPPERRGLILVDPPYEAADEFERVVGGLRRGYGRFPSGVFAVWYPVKHRAPVRQFFASVCAAGIRDVIAAELCIREPIDSGRLNGSGLLIVNPPYGFEAEAGPILSALLDRLADGEPGARISLTRLTDE